MDWYRISSFAEETDILSRFLRFIATAESYGSDPFLSATGSEDYDKALTTIKNMDTMLSAIHRVAKSIDGDLAEYISNTFLKSNYPADLSRLKIRIESSLWMNRQTTTEKIKRAVQKNDPILVLGRIIGSAFLQVVRLVSTIQIEISNQSSFKRADIDIELIISLTDRLSSACNSLSDRIYSLLSEEMEIKPAGINIEHVDDLIQHILNDLDRHYVDEETKRRIVTLVTSARAELNSQRPSWSKVVGALMIASTILGGASTIAGSLADAPEAFQNVNKAIEYILGLAKRPHIQRPTLPPSNFDIVET